MGLYDTLLGLLLVYSSSQYPKLKSVLCGCLFFICEFDRSREFYNIVKVFDTRDKVQCYFAKTTL